MEVKPTLLVEGVSLLLGNDIAGGQVMNSPAMSVKQVKQEYTVDASDVGTGAALQ